MHNKKIIIAILVAILVFPALVLARNVVVLLGQTTPPPPAEAWNFRGGTHVDDSRTLPAPTGSQAGDFFITYMLNVMGTSTPPAVLSEDFDTTGTGGFDFFYSGELAGSGDLVWTDYTGVYSQLVGGGWYGMSNPSYTGVSSYATDTSDVGISVPVTTPVANCLIVYVGIVNAIEAWSATPPPGVTYVSNEGNGLMMAFEVKATAGLSDSRHFDYDHSDEWALFAIVYRPN